jgi:hypothetical protein
MFYKKNSFRNTNRNKQNCDDSDPTFAGVLRVLTADNVMVVIPEPLRTIAGSYTISATLAPIVLNNYNITYNTAKFIITDTTPPVIADSNTNDRCCYSSFCCSNG